MIDSLEQLAQYVRERVPQPKAILNLHVKDKIGAVSFVWHAREFVVKKSLEVLELKGQNLYVTGATMLMQTALTSVGKSETIIGSVIDAIRQAEDLITNEKQRESGLQLLKTAKATLRKQVAH